MVEDYYLCLGVPRNAPIKEIGRAYRQKVGPLCVNGEPDRSALALFVKLTEARETLSDPEKRAQYDATLPPDLKTTATKKDDILDLTRPPDRRPLPPHLSRASVEFQLLEQDESSIPQIRVEITNPNKNPHLQPVLRSSTGQFWWASLHVNGERSYFTISPKLDMAPAAYRDRLEVHWDGMLDLSARLDVSLTVTRKPPDRLGTTALEETDVFGPADHSLTTPPDALKLMLDEFMTEQSAT